MALTELRESKWGQNYDENDGTFTVEDSPWKFEFTINYHLSRVDFYYEDKYIFAFIRWKFDSKENTIGYDHTIHTDELPKDLSLWHTGTIPGELFAAAINVVYNREMRK